MAIVHRLVNDDEKSLLREGLAALEPLILNYQDVARRRRYFHLYKQEQTSNVITEKLHRRFMLFAAQLRQELADASLIETSDEMTHYGYLVSLPGAPAQDWHVDYDGDLVIIYVPLTRESERNATQYLEKSNGYSVSLQFLNATDDEIPLICTQRQSIHRGIANDEAYRRVVFYFMYSKLEWKNPEPLFDLENRSAVNVDADTRYRAEVEDAPSS